MLIGTLKDWTNAYLNGADPSVLLEQQRLACLESDPAWISIATASQLQRQIADLALLKQAHGLEHLPLYGIPFAVKDNIDVAGFRTTAACEAFAYAASEDAFAVLQLKRAGAIVMGKTNLDQFATGLVGTRSPYGAVPNVFDPALISGGSSSGSASAVARGLVPFALSTDTAGSGRIPAGLNQIVGIKPTPGAVSCTGLVPACRTLDCIGVLACTVADSALVLSVMEGADASDPYSKERPHSVKHIPFSKLRIAVPARRQLSKAYETAFSAYLAMLKASTAQLDEVAFDTLFDVARLLYQGPWVAERVVAAGRIYDSCPEHMLPTVKNVLDVAQQFDATDTFKAQYRLQALRRDAEKIWAHADVLCVPTAPRHPSIEEVANDPIAVNSELGIYTNFVNLLGWSAIALPASRLPDGLPFGVTLIAPAWREPDLVRWAMQLEQQVNLPAGVTGLRATPEFAQQSWRFAPSADRIKVAVVGAHLRGMPLNGELENCDARLLQETCSAPNYRLFALHGTKPPKPALVRSESGAPIVLEVWDMPVANFGRFVAGIPQPLGIGNVMLESGETVKGFICESHALQEATDITDFGGWRAYCNRQT
jgi:allophanate hydrolase